MTGEGIIVRDCVQDILPHVTWYTRPVTNTDEYERLLRKKLLEECGEAITATSPAEFVEEAGDVLQVLIDLAGLYGADPADIFDARNRKRDARGSFGTVLCARQPDKEHP